MPKNKKGLAASDKAEAEAVKNTMKTCNLLGLKPEEMGLRKGADGAYYTTYQTVQLASRLSLTMAEMGLPEKGRTT
ncbi:MAG: hypothetical protein ABSG19_12390 [Candidatus Aminicenantales bacterium]